MVTALRFYSYPKRRARGDELKHCGGGANKIPLCGDKGGVIVAYSAVKMRLDCLNQLVRGKRFMNKAVSA